MNDVKMAFVRDVLSRKGAEMQNAIIRSITREGLSSPSEGIAGRYIQGSGVEGFEMDIPVLRRFQDMGAPLNKNLISENVYASNSDMLQPKRRKKYPVYNRNVWGHYSSIARELMYGLTDEVVKSIKDQLNTR